MSSTSHLPEPQINATPLIDVLLVLLVMLILMVPIATHTVERQFATGRRRAAIGAGAPRNHVSTGDIYWNGQHVASIEELLPRLAELASRAESTVVEGACPRNARPTSASRRCSRPRSARTSRR